MRSAFAVFLRGFTLPFGATSGRRIFLDGDVGRILFYNTAGDIVGVAEVTATDIMKFTAQLANGARAELQSSGSAAFLVLDPADEVGHTMVAGSIAGDYDPTVGVTRPSLNFRSPTVDGQDAGRIFLVGENTTGARPFVSIDGGAGLEADFILNRKSMPRGITLGGKFSNTTTDDAARAAGVNTDMSVTFDADSTRCYAITLNAAAVAGALNVLMFIELHDGTVNVGRFFGGVMVAGQYISNTIIYYPGTTGTKTLTVRNGAGSANTLSMQRGLPDITARTLTVIDSGRLSLAV